MRFNLLLALLVFTDICTAQKTISGQVVSLIDSTPVADLRLIFNHKKEVRTDANGNFTVTGPRKKTLYGSSYYFIERIDTLRSTRNSLQLKLYITQTFDSAAQIHIANNKMMLFCGGGFIPASETKGDIEFEKAYGVSYQYLGCIMPSPQELSSYNLTIAHYLDQKFGTDWRKSLRNDVWGITKLLKDSK